MEQIFEQLRGEGGTPSPDALRRAAAALGPGLGGKRAELSDDEWSKRAEQVRALYEQAGLGDAPAYLKSRTEWKDRKAKLFEIGEYSDKSINVTERDLQSLAQSFDAPVPILIEHVENPLRLGYLTQVEAAGPELFGMLALTSEAHELLESSGAKSLSLSVARDFSKIVEVSIVGNPRVESARLFCADFRSESNAKERTELTQLRAEVEAMKVREAIEELSREGIVVPSNREAAEELMRVAKRAGFETEAVAFLRSLPKRVRFGETAPASRATVDMPREELEFYKNHFPGVPVEEIAKRKEKAAWQH